MDKIKNSKIKSTIDVCNAMIGRYNLDIKVSYNNGYIIEGKIPFEIAKLLSKASEENNEYGIQICDDAISDEYVEKYNELKNNIGKIEIEEFIKEYNKVNKVLDETKDSDKYNTKYVITNQKGMLLFMSKLELLPYVSENFIDLSLTTEEYFSKNNIKRNKKVYEDTNDEWLCKFKNLLVDFDNSVNPFMDKNNNIEIKDNYGNVDLEIKSNDYGKNKNYQLLITNGENRAYMTRTNKRAVSYGYCSNANGYSCIRHDIDELGERLMFNEQDLNIAFDITNNKMYNNGVMINETYDINSTKEFLTQIVYIANNEISEKIVNNMKNNNKSLKKK